MASVRHSGYRVSCGAGRFLGVCGQRQHETRSPYRTTSPRDTYQYNAFQRLAGMIADRMEAGNVGNLKIRLKIILE
ncbi:MAG: hypothetical protein HY554_16500 [Elusimicrobia bacterium]|nr:hypothetical protein [Elusimicrobiota bacterium]